MAAKPQSTFETVALSVLAYEFASSNKEESEEKIRSRLRRKGLGAFDAVRIETLRKLKDEVQREIGKQGKSSYYQRRSSGKPRSGYVDIGDFDVQRLAADLIARYPEIPEKELLWFVPYATFIYHML